MSLGPVSLGQLGCWTPDSGSVLLVLHGSNSPVFRIQKHCKCSEYVSQRKGSWKSTLTLARANTFSRMDYFSFIKEPSPLLSDTPPGLKYHFDFSDSILSRLPAAQAVAEGFLCILPGRPGHVASVCVFNFVICHFSVSIYYSRNY